MKEKIYKVKFHFNGGVELFEEMTNIKGHKQLWSVAIMDSLESAIYRARELCPDGYIVRVLSILPDEEV